MAPIATRGMYAVSTRDMTPVASGDMPPVVAGGMCVECREGVVALRLRLGGNEINERDMFYAPFTCESEQDFQIQMDLERETNKPLKRHWPPTLTPPHSVA